MRRIGTFRFLVLLVALVAMLGVATAASSPAHIHLKPPANGCDICFTAHIASLEAKTIAIIAQPPQIQRNLTDCAAIPGYQLFRTKASLTRGPPSSSLA